MCLLFIEDSNLSWRSLMASISKLTAVTDSSMHSLSNLASSSLSSRALVTQCWISSLHLQQRHYRNFAFINYYSSQLTAPTTFPSPPHASLGSSCGSRNHTSVLTSPGSCCTTPRCSALPPETETLNVNLKTTINDSYQLLQTFGFLFLAEGSGHLLFSLSLASWPEISWMCRKLLSF